MSLSFQPSVYDSQSFYPYPVLNEYITSHHLSRNNLKENPCSTVPLPTEHIIYTIPIKVHWNIGLCDCCVSSSKDVVDKKVIYNNCLKGFFSPCCLFKKLTKGLDGDDSNWNCLKCCCCCCCIRSGYRRKTRRLYNLPATPCNDCCIICCCPCCSLVQEVNEVETEHKYPRNEIMKM